MAEQTLNNPLSGFEVIEAIIDKLRITLRTSGNFRENDSFDWFTAKVSLEIDRHDTGVTMQSDHIVKLSEGTMPSGDKEHAEADFYIEAAPPNEVRVATGQPVPTLTKDAQGKTVQKGVRYARKDAAKAKSLAVLLLGLLMTGMALGQKKPDTPSLTPSQIIAINSLIQRNTEIKARQDAVTRDAQQALTELRAVEAEFAAAHPGYHFDEATRSVVKDEIPKKDSK